MCVSVRVVCYVHQPCHDELDDYFSSALFVLISSESVSKSAKLYMPASWGLF